MSSNQQLVFDPKNPPNSLLLSQIIIGDRFRRDLGDLASLVSSIKEIGLLHPIVIDENRKLIAGRRRLASCQILEWNDILIRVVNLSDLVHGEFHENSVRKDFTKKEVLAIHHALEPKLKEDAKKNQGKRNDLIEHSAESAQSSKRTKNKKSRDIIAEYAGLSHDSISKLEDIERESQTNPQYGKLLEDIDNDSKKETINSVFKKLQKERKISELEKSQDKFHEQIKKRYNKIYCEYDDKITALEKKRDKLYRSLEKEEEKANKKTEKKIDYLYSPISHVKRIIYFLNQKQLKLDFDHTKTTNRYGYLELVEQYTTDHLKLACYIAENRRPKNKYSLVIVGICRFGDNYDSKILKLPYDFSVSFHNDDIHSFDIEYSIKHFDSIESAKKYHRTHEIGQALNSFLVAYHAVLEQYQETVNNYTLEDFTEILTGDND